MVIKIRKKDKSKKVIRYKGTKKILTPRDIREADRFDNALNKEIRKIEKILLKNRILGPETKKLNILNVWYLIGVWINKFLKKNKVSPDEEKLFWDNLYGRSSIIYKTVPLGKISRTRNDFRIASILAHQSLDKLQKIGIWSLWREIVTYKAFADERVLKWVLKKIEQSLPLTRNEARPFLKATSKRLKKIDTTVLNNKELLDKLNEVKLDNQCANFLRRAGKKALLR